MKEEKRRVKKLFLAIRHGELETVKQLIEKNPKWVNCTAQQPPKKDDGQSPLQVALKTGNFEIADYLIDRNADLNFMEAESCCNKWRAPVIHDAVIAAVMCSRWNTNDKYQGLRVFSTESRAGEAIAVLAKMLDRGGDVNAVDSFGYSVLFRFCFQAEQILPRWIPEERREAEDRVFTEELRQDLIRILQLLKQAGADPAYQAPILGKSVLARYQEGSLAMLLKEVFGNS